MFVSFFTTPGPAAERLVTRGPDGNGEVVPHLRPIVDISPKIDGNSRVVVAAVLTEHELELHGAEIKKFFRALGKG